MLATENLLPTNREFGMRTIIYSIGAIAVIAAAIFIWEKSPVVGPRVVRASAIDTVEQTQPSEATPRISPSELMVKHGKTLPVEYWSHPF
jgi:hypothetical protein